VVAQLGARLKRGAAVAGSPQACRERQDHPAPPGWDRRSHRHPRPLAPPKPPFPSPTGSNGSPARRSALTDANRAVPPPSLDWNPSTHRPPNLRGRASTSVTQTSRRSLSCTPLFRICVWRRIPSCITIQVAAAVDGASFAWRSASNGRPRIRTARDAPGSVSTAKNPMRPLPVTGSYALGHHKATTKTTWTAPARPRMQVARTANTHRIRRGRFQGT
jgi:hypothetical protein